LLNILNHGISANALHQTSISTRNIEGLNMKKLALALAATAAFAGQAIAADLAVKAARPAPPPVPVANWTGCYVAGSVGYGLFDNETSNRDVFGVFTGVPGAPSLGRTDYGGRGWLAGGGGGCDYQFGLGTGGGLFGTGQFVIGLLADYYWSDMRGDRGSPSVGNFFTGQEKVDQQWAVGGRVGWLVNPNTLTYFSGGYTEARLNGIGNFFSPISPAFGGGFAGLGLPGRTVHGYFLGGGVEYQSGWIPGLTWKTEYRFSEYDRVDRAEFFNAPPFTGTATGFVSNDKLFTQTVMTSLVYRFNFWSPPVAAKY
jgi:outer membrane immunogenic protein